MAKTPQGPGRSKVRIFFVDADLAPGDMQELTNALTNAVRPTHMITMRPPAARLAAAPSGDGAAQDEDELELEEIVGDNGDDAADVARGPARPRRYRSPKVVADLDPRAGAKSFEQFAHEKGMPDDHPWRFLVAAYWLAEYAEVAEATVDHVYTCYRAVEWKFDVKDPGHPFRYLGRLGLGTTKGGRFTINHLGRAKVQDMIPATAAP